MMKKNEAILESRLIRDILYSKEKDGLRTQNIVRLFMIIFYLPVSAILAQSVFERIFSSIILVLSICITVIFLWLIKKDGNFTMIGVLGAVVDVLLVTAFTVIWYLTVGGTLDKFIGDAIMATFGTPRCAPDDAVRAVRAAMEMEDALIKYNDTRKRRNLFLIEHGIGIHYGPALVGNIGTRERLEYTVLGDTVNAASRIENSCKKIGESLLFSGAVDRYLAGVIRTRKVGSIRVRGKSEVLDLFTVEGGLEIKISCPS